MSSEGKKPVEIVFDGPPSHESGRFVEVERDGKSINYGEWREGDDGFWYLVLPNFEARIDTIIEKCRVLLAGWDGYSDQEKVGAVLEISRACEGGG